MRVLISATTPEKMNKLLNEFFFSHSWLFCADNLRATNVKNGKRIPDDTPELAFRRKGSRFELLHLD